MEAAQFEIGIIMLRLSLLALAVSLSGAFPVNAVAQAASASTQESIQNANLTVSVSKIRNDKGQIIIWLWNSPDGFPTQSAKSLKRVSIEATKVVDGSVTTTFEMSPGTYGVTVLHDENNNGDMDTNMLGIPTEGIGTSNNVVTHFRAPSFQQVSFAVLPAGRKVEIAIRY